jgi:hypothetical protein
LHKEPNNSYLALYAEESLAYNTMVDVQSNTTYKMYDVGE